MTCADLEILLCDYLDGTLSSAERTSLEEHIAACGGCAQFARDVAGATAFLETVTAAEPPRELVARILQDIPVRRDNIARASWRRRLWSGWLLQPRLAMGLAMTILSISMFASLGRLQPKQLTSAALDPARVWQSLDDRTYRVWDRTIQYYDNMPLVMDIESKWRDWNEQGQELESADRGSPARPDAVDRNGR